MAALTGLAGFPLRRPANGAFTTPDPMYQLRTIDVWDTLLRRACHPDFVKLATARHLVLLEHARLNPPHRDHWSILRERCRIEGELAAEARAQGRDDEYHLEEVLARLVRHVLAGPDIDAARLAAQLAKYELDFEHRHTYPDPGCRDFLDLYPARTSIFLSDFYMSSDALMRLIRHHGLDDLVEGGLSSCDVGLNKRSGKLFGHAQAMHGAAPERHIHIGDNPHADVEAPRRHGVEAVHYLPEAEHAARLARERLFANRATLFAHIEKEAVAAADAVLAEATRERREAFLLGVYTAPLLIGFMLAVAERALLDRVEKLFFFTREGEFFIEVYRTLFPGNRFAGLGLPPAKTLAVSRLATFCASLGDISTQEMMRLWNLYSTQSMHALFKSLGLAPEAFEAHCRRHGLTLSEAVTYPWQDARVQGLFADTAFRAALADKIASDRERLLAYLDQEGWQRDTRRVGIVDIGWRGTIQDNLALLRPDSQVAGYYLGLQRVLNAQPANCAKHAFGPDLNRRAELPELLDAVAPLEMLCNSPHGSVTGYEAEAGRLRVHRLVDADENAVHERFTQHFQDGVLHAAAYWARYIDSHAIASEEVREAACGIWRTLIARTPDQLLHAFSTLKHNETFGVGGFVDKQEIPGTLAILRGLLSRDGRREILFFLRKNQWPQALWRRSDVGLGNRLVLLALMLAARLYKRLRARLR